MRMARSKSRWKSFSNIERNSYPGFLKHQLHALNEVGTPFYKVVMVIARVLWDYPMFNTEKCGKNLWRLDFFQGIVSKLEEDNVGVVIVESIQKYKGRIGL